MSHVKISNPPGVVGQTKIEVDGHPIPDVTRIQMDFPPDDMAQVHVGIAVTRPFEFEGDAQVNLHLHVPEGCKLIEVTTHSDPSGTKKWMVAKVIPLILMCLLAAPAFAQGVIKYTKARPLTPQQAADILRPNETQIPPALPNGPTVTFTGATTPNLGPWDNHAIRSSYSYGYQVTAYGSHPGYAWGRHLPVRSWQSQDRAWRLHVLSSARVARPTRAWSSPSGPRYHAVQRNMSRLQHRVPQHLLRSTPGAGERRSAGDVASERGRRSTGASGRRQAAPSARQR